MPEHRRGSPLRWLLMGAGTELGYALGRALAQVQPDSEYLFADEARTLSASQRLSQLAHLGEVMELPWTASSLVEAVLAKADLVVVIPDGRMEAGEMIGAAASFVRNALVGGRPVILWSDSFVYGPCQLVPTEQSPIHPPTERAAALAAIETAALLLGQVHRVPVWVLRPPLLWGPGLVERPSELIKPDPVEPTLYELLHIEDAARYVHRMAEVELASGIYNLGPGDRVVDAYLGGRRTPILPRRALRVVDASKLMQALDPMPVRRHRLAQGPEGIEPM